MRESAGGVENRAVEGGDTMRRVRTLGLLGTGVIGGGWAARALHFGIDVVAADLSRHAPPDVVIASSTSGLMPSDLQLGMAAPERFLVAHPFNPVYLLPLVELVGGRQTAAATLDGAARFFSYIGMHPLKVR